MEAKSKSITADILKFSFCKNCGWPVIDACCNDEFVNFKDAKKWDWWQYCSNKGCKNHEGEGIFQETPDWIQLETEKERVETIITEAIIRTGLSREEILRYMEYYFKK